MASNYFSGVYPQLYLGNGSNGIMALATSGTPNQLTPGMIGLYQTNQNGYVTSAISSGTTLNVTLAMGSWHTISSVMPNYIDLQQPQYSKTIQWSNVTMFQYIKGHVLQNEIVSIGWNQLTSGAAAVGPVFYCATNYFLKVEVQGDAALATLNKNLYVNLQAWGGCCSTGCSSGCTSTAVDAAYIMLQWKDALNQNPLMTPYLSPAVFISSGVSEVQVYSAYDNSLNSALPIYVPNTASPTSVIAAFQLTVAYVGTNFNDCTFTPRDRFEYSPLWIQASLVTQNADPCAFNTTINTSVPNMFTILQQPQGSIGSGEFIKRAFIDSNRYRQQPFADGMDVDILRMRSIEDDTSGNVNRSATYDIIVLEFHINRHDNPTAVHSNDQYQVVIPLPTGTNVTSFLNLITNSLTLAGSGVTLETIS